MRKLLIVILAVLCIVPPVYSEEADKWAVKLPTAVKKITPGKYDLTSPSPGIYNPRGVKGLLYIPASVKKAAPLIVFYHGMAIGQKDAYKNNDSVAKMMKWADQKKYMLLSAQNVWGYNDQYDTAAAMLSSCRATVDFIDALNKANVIKSDRVYATGFSAGGFVALAMGIYRPDLVRGIGDFKGNFYFDSIQAVLYASTSALEFLNLPADSRKVDDLVAYLCVGGSSDAARVLVQMPEAKAYLESLGVSVKYQTFSEEGHVLTPADFESFWSYISKAAN